MIPGGGVLYVTERKGDARGRQVWAASGITAAGSLWDEAADQLVSLMKVTL